MSQGDGELFKDKIEVSLDGRQIFYLFFGGAVIACMVFVLGVMVGRRVEARSHVESGAETRAALDPLAALDQLEASERQEGLVFPRALHGESRDELSLGEIDESLEEGTEIVEADAPEKREAPGGSEQPEEDAAEEPEEDEAEEPEEGATEELEEDEEGKERKEGKEGKEGKEDAESADPERSRARYTLQLSSFQDEEEARSFRSELEDAGYDPFLVKADVPDRGVWYRVRLGHYGTYKDALKAKEKFERDQHIIAYVTRLPR